jgi:restriction endonuclease S subunit
MPWVSAKDLKSDRISNAELHISGDAVKQSATKIAPAGSLLMLVRGMGLANGVPIAEVTGPVAFNQDIRAIHPPQTVMPRFLLLALRAHLMGEGGERILSSAAHGTLKIDAELLRELAFPLPPLPEQHRIVAILDEAFAGIATAKANAEQNLKNARALFESHLQSAFADAWQTGELVALADLATDITDGDHMPPPKATSGVPFITIGNVIKNTRVIDFTDTFMVSKEYFDGLKPNKKPRKGDVLYTVTGSYGVPVLVTENRDFCFQRHIGLVRPRPDVDSEWLYYLLMSPQVLAQANDGATGTAQKTVSLKLLRGFQVPRVPLARQQSSAAKLKSVITETQRLASLYQRKLAALDELKKSLLHQAFSGQL